MGEEAWGGWGVGGGGGGGGAEGGGAVQVDVCTVTTRMILH